MERLKILKSKEVKKIRELLIEQFNFALEGDYAYLENSKGKIFVVNKDISQIPLDKLKVDRFGIYFCEKKHENIRLSLEGAQLLAIEAKKAGVELTNVIDLDRRLMKAYYAGVDLTHDSEETKHILLSYKGEVFGSSKLKEGKILNFLPKIHRGDVML